MSSTAVQPSHLWAVEQAQQSLEFATVVGGGVELEGKSASIKSISECIKSTNAISFSTCTISFFGLRPTASTSARYRAALHDADKNERKGKR